MPFMGMILGGIFAFVSAVFYIRVFRNRLSYLTAPDWMISSNTKTSLLMFQVTASVTVAILCLKFWFPYSELHVLVCITLLLLFYAATLILLGVVIDKTIRLFMPEIKKLDEVVQNPRVVMIGEEYYSSKLFNEEDFWEIINAGNDLVLPREVLSNYDKIRQSLVRLHPTKIIEFSNRLNQERTNLVTTDIYELCLYIWQRKFGEIYLDGFIDFIIVQGRKRVYEIMNDPDLLSNYDFDAHALHDKNLDIPVINAFVESTGLVFKTSGVDIDPNLLKNQNADKKRIRQKFPMAYEKFK